MNIKRRLALQALAGVIFVPLQAARAADSRSLQQLIDAARKEAVTGDFFVSMTQPNQDATYRALFDAFEKRFNLTVRYRWQSHHQDYYPLVISEAAAHRRTPDVLSGSPANVLTLDTAGLVAAVDWKGYENTLPGLADAVDSAMAALRGKALAQFDVIYTIVYNTQQINLDAVPRTLQDLTDSKWSGKLALNSQGSPLDTLGLSIGHERMLDLVRKIKANRPVLKAGAPGVVAAVANGETPIGLGYTTGAEQQKTKGAPIAWAPLKDYIPVLQQVLMVLKSAANPNLARLFAAFVVSDEGLAIQDKFEFMGRVSSRGTPTWKRLQEMSPSAKIVQAASPHDLMLDAQYQKENTQLFAQ